MFFLTFVGPPPFSVSADKHSHVSSSLRTQNSVTMAIGAGVGGATGGNRDRAQVPQWGNGVKWAGKKAKKKNKTKHGA